MHGAWDAAATAATDQGSDPDVLARAVNRVLDRVAERAERDGERLDVQVRHFHGKVEETLKARVEPGLANAIRDHWRKRSGKLTEVPAAMLDVANGGQETTSAVLSALPYLSGLTAESHRVLYEEAAANYAPDDWSAYNEAVELRAKVDKAARRFSGEMKKRLPGWIRRQPASLDRLREMAK